MFQFETFRVVLYCLRYLNLIVKYTKLDHLKLLITLIFFTFLIWVKISILIGPKQMPWSRHNLVSCPYSMNRIFIGMVVPVSVSEIHLTYGASYLLPYFTQTLCLLDDWKTL